MNLGNTQIEFCFEKAIEALAKHLPIAKSERKPVLMHDLRVGMFLYERGYPKEVVIGGLLHDIFEQSDIHQDMIGAEFGNDVLAIVLANTQNSDIADTVEKWKDMVNRCVIAGKNALIVKAADVFDSLGYYLAKGNQAEIERSKAIGHYLLESLPKDVEDPLFVELQSSLTL